MKIGSCITINNQDMGDNWRTVQISGQLTRQWLGKHFCILHLIMTFEMVTSRSFRIYPPKYLPFFPSLPPLAFRQDEYCTEFWDASLAEFSRDFARSIVKVCCGWRFATTTDDRLLTTDNDWVNSIRAYTYFVLRKFKINCSP